MNPDTFKRLQDADWENIWRNLLAFAISRAQIYQWRSGSVFVLPKGMTPEDVVQHVIKQTIDGERNWNPALGELLPWLKDQVKSVIDAICHSWTHRHETKTLIEEDDPDSFDSEGTNDERNNNTFVAASESLEQQIETARELDDQVNDLFAAIAGEPELEQVVNAVLNGCEPKPRYLAQELGITILEVNNRLKRLKRRAMKPRKVLQ